MNVVLDATLVTIYLIALLFLGFSARLKDNSVIQYIVAGRNLTWPLAMVSLVCTWYGGILGVGESVSYYGVGSWLMIGVPYYAFGILYALYLAPLVRQAAQYSIPERMRQVFGPRAGMISAALVFLLAVPAAHMLMLGVLVQWFSHLAVLPAMAIGGALGAAFLFRGGLLADVRASILAFVAMYIGFAVLVAVCVSNQSLADAVAKLPVETRTFTGGQSPTMILSFFLLGAWTLADPGFHQRVASAQDSEASRKCVLWSVVAWMVFDALSISAGIYAVGHASEGLPPLLLFPALADHVLPPGIRALFYCGMFGTIICAMVGYSLVAGASLGRDLATYFRPDMTEAQQKQFTRVGIGISLFLALVIANYVQSVVALWYAWAGVIIGALLIPLLLAYSNRPVKLRHAWIEGAMVGAFCLSFAGWIYGNQHQNPYLMVKLFGLHDFSLGTLLPGLFVSAILLFLGRVADNRAKNHGT